VAHFGLLPFRGSGHLNPLLTLARTLVARGHQVTVFQQPDLQQRVLAEGLEFAPVHTEAVGLRPGERTLAPMPGMLGKLQNTHVRLAHINDEVRQYLASYPPAIRAAGVDALLVGEISLAGPTVAEMLGLPYFVVSTTIPHNFGWHAPPTVQLHLKLCERLDKHVLEVSVLHMHGPVRWALNRQRRRLGLRGTGTRGTPHPELAHISQWPACLDEPRQRLPANFFYTGPFLDESRAESIDFPWDRLDGRPLIYASLGTTKKGEFATLRNVALASARLGFQAVLSLGNAREPDQGNSLPERTILVRNAPQLALLARAQIVVTHAGPNTALESLLHGKPMLALPITLDQPAVASRLAQAGAAEVLARGQRGEEDIFLALERLWKQPAYTLAAERLQADLMRLKPLDHAVAILEEKLAAFLLGDR
jgi:zeaxanthin glucosyltransferase